MGTDNYLGSIGMFGGNFAIRGWAFCDGQLLAISAYTALFSLYGTMYGGDGRTTFGLPELRGRVAIHKGHGPGLPDFRQGAKGGATTTTLNVTNLPSHNHAGALQVGQEGKGVTALDTAAGNYLGNSTGTYRQNTGTAGSSIQGVTTGNTGGGQSFNNMQPYQVITFQAALVGIYPPRN